MQISKRILNMTDGKRDQLSRDLAKYGDYVEATSRESLLVLIQQREGVITGQYGRVLRLRAWYRVFKRQDPCKSPGYTPPDLLLSGRSEENEEGSAPLQEEKHKTYADLINDILDSGSSPPPGADSVMPEEAKVEYEQKHPDYMTVNVKAQAAVMSVDDFVRVSKLDTTKWHIVSHSGNTWTTAMKLKTRVGQKEDGTPIYEEEPIVVRNWQVSVKCVRRIDAGWTPPEVMIVKADTIRPKRRNDGHLVALVWPDLQLGYRRRQNDKLIPLHDWRCIDLGLQLIEELRPDALINSGDTVDGAPWSTKYPTDPDLVGTMVPTLHTAHYLMAAQRAMLPIDSPCVWHHGNHDMRYDKAVGAALKDTASYVKPGDKRPHHSLGAMLDVDKLGIEYIEPYGASYWLWDSIESIHGDTVRSEPGATTSAALKSRTYSLFFGHIHRVEGCYKPVFGPNGRHRQIFAASFGCMCRTGAGIVPAVKHKNLWQHGFGVIRKCLSSGVETFEPILVHRGICHYQGKRFVSDAPRLVAEVSKSIGIPLEQNWLLPGE